ncbi:hypothetical protein CYMTET_18443 [Cymbomonas tetramitiformis]|uniref:Uncharacterized protein n=1 Tax=Cymbomonas tetramitiformis TaxID=36881 RepID=A0AAE0G895_9CHLO|nr:hypothetical protein CYMTET_18443 [Cymbomonas tetramitiformis]
MLARRFVVGIAHQSFSKNAVLCANEIVKMIFSLVMTSRAHSSNLSRHLTSLIRTSSPRMGGGTGICISRGQLDQLPSTNNVGGGTA